MADETKILVLRHIPVEGPALLGALMAQRGMAYEILDVGPGVAWPADAEAFQGLLILGGPQSVYEKGRFPYLQAEEDFVGMALRAGRPVMGICLGAQMLAQVLGAKVFRNPRGKEIGWAQVDLLPDAQQDPLFQGLPASFQAFHWHGDTFDLPLGCKPLASSALTPNQAFSWNGQAWALQFHLEVEAQDIRAWLAEYASEAQGAQDAEAGLARHYAAYREVGLKVFGRFLDLAAL